MKWNQVEPVTTRTGWGCQHARGCHVEWLHRAGAGFSGSRDGGGEEPPQLTREQGHASMLGTPVRHPGRAPTQLHDSDSLHSGRTSALLSLSTLLI